MAGIFKPTITTQEKLNSIPLKEGRFIILENSNNFAVDLKVNSVLTRKVYDFEYLISKLSGFSDIFTGIGEFSGSVPLDGTEATGTTIELNFTDSDGNTVIFEEMTGEDYNVVINPCITSENISEIAGTLGEIWIKKESSSFTVYRTGTYEGKFNFICTFK